MSTRGRGRGGRGMTGRGMTPQGVTTTSVQPSSAAADPTPAPSPSQSSSAAVASGSTLPSPNPSPPSLPPSPNPRLPSDLHSSSPSLPPPLSSSASPSSSSSLQPAHQSPPPLQSAHPSPPPLQSAHPSPPPLQPALLSSLNPPSSGQKFGELASQVFSSTFKFLMMKIDMVCAVLNIIAQGISSTLAQLAERNIDYCTFLGLIFGFVAVAFSIGEVYWLKVKKLPIGVLAYVELIMGVLQFTLAVLTFLHFWDDSLPIFKFLSSLLLALFVGYCKVTKKPVQCPQSEMDTDSIVVIHIDSLKAAPLEVGEWISKNRLQDLRLLKNRLSAK